MKESEKSHADKIVEEDIGEKVDLFWAIADTYNIEKHLEHSIINVSIELDDKNPRKKHLIRFLQKLLDDVRVIRSKAMKELEVTTIFDLWCPFKHLTGAVMQFIEVATREIHKGNYEKADLFFTLSRNLFAIFWTLIELGKKWKEGDEEFIKWISRFSNICSK